jgi:hypothetical protein
LGFEVVGFLAFIELKAFVEFNELGRLVNHLCWPYLFKHGKPGTLSAGLFENFLPVSVQKWEILVSAKAAGISQPQS